MDILERLHELRIALPSPPQPAASYLTVSAHDGLLYVSGQGPMMGLVPAITGIVGETVTEAEAYDAARMAAINALAALHGSVGLQKVKRIIKLNGYVASARTFDRHHKVIDGASELLSSVFGDDGRHSRCAVGVYCLPFNIPVEIEIVASMR